MRIHDLLPPLPPLPPREPQPQPPPSRTGVALARLEDLQVRWGDGKQRRRRPSPDADPAPVAEESEVLPSATGLNITA